MDHLWDTPSPETLLKDHDRTLCGAPTLVNYISGPLRCEAPTFDFFIVRVIFDSERVSVSPGRKDVPLLASEVGLSVRVESLSASSCF